MTLPKISIEYNHSIILTPHINSMNDLSPSLQLFFLASKKILNLL